jgi:hypothetical protein
MHKKFKKIHFIYLLLIISTTLKIKKKQIIVKLFLEIGNFPVFKFYSSII